MKVGRQAKIIELIGRYDVETQEELCDLLTSHPYPHSPSKTPSRVDEHTSIRSVFQATVETLLYSDIGRRPGAVEEIGTFAPSYCAEKEKADFIRNAMFNAWAHGAEYFLWWCAFEQSHLPFPPYEWSAWERELGFFTADMREKPVAETFRQFRAYRDSLPIRELPPFRRDAICILPMEQDFDHVLSNAWSAFLLAKQSGFDIRFQYGRENPDNAPLYLLPGLRGASGLYRTQIHSLLEKVKNGATLYLSLDDGSLSPFTEVFGVESGGREARTAPARIRFQGKEYEIAAPFRLHLRTIHADVLAEEEDGNPVYTRTRFGKGEIYFLTLPMEYFLAGKPGAFHRETAAPWRNFYRAFSRTVLSKRLLRTDDPFLTLTEHPDPADSGRCWCVAVNNRPSPVHPEFRMHPDWRLESGLQEIAPFSGTLLLLTRKKQSE